MARIDDMTNGRPLGLLVRFALPLMAGYVFQLLYSIADSAVVGRLIGVSAFAAVSATGFSHWLMMDIVMGLGQGFCTLLAQRHGARDEAGFRRAAGTAMMLMAIVGMALSVLGATFARPMLMWLGTPGDILGDAVVYLRILAGGMILTAMYNLLSALLMSIGDSRTPLIAMILSTLINIGLDIPLVLLTPLGVRAVAATTLVAQAFAIVYCALALRKVPGALPGAADLHIDRASARALLRLGGPGALRNGIVSMGGLAVQAVVNSYGSQFVAGVALPNRLYGIMEIVGGGLEGAVAVFVAQNHGAHKIDRIERGVGTARRLMLGSSIAIGVLMLLLGRPLMTLMIGGEGTDAILIVAQRQLMVMIAGLPALYMLLLYRTVVQGMGNAVVPMVCGFVELGVRLLCVWWLTRLLGEWGAYMAVSAGWPMAMLPVLIAYRRRIRRERQLHREGSFVNNF